ncbi:MAG: aminotransferase class I/II-fold pyridoxal phosphate-dependent enzyme, partial [Phycisphaerae bacterium]|nr:aminotransferase class I/II-fold pyridoxal phosphate-dependent enzyme [Phycisphaerae bacterium]
TALEQALAALEGAPFALAFASGLAAAQAVLLSLECGDRVVASRDLYGGCHRLFTKVFSRFGVSFDFVDTTDLGQVRRSLEAPAKWLWLETPSNPLLSVTDLEACAEIAKRRGARTLVDNTFATPILQRPLDLGADLVLHSTTKYIGGHCDAIGGALVTRDEALHAELRFLQNAAGAVPGPQDCYLLLRGIRTLGLRVQRHAESAAQLADRLDSLPGVSRVLFPGRRDHPQHGLASRQFPGFGAVISFELEGGRDAASAFVRGLKLWTLAESLGGVRSLICHPATMTHASLTPAERAWRGIGDGLLRLSVGLEDRRDLWDDLEHAAGSVRAAPRECGTGADRAALPERAAIASHAPARTREEAVR